MKQLLIVNSNKAIDAGLTSNAVTDLSALQEGAISLFELGALVSLAETAAKPATKNFGIALGKGTNKPALVIPEVDIDTLEIVHTLPYKGATFTASFTMPTTVVGKEYTIIMCKKGVVPNERNLFTVSIVAGTTTAATEAGKLRNAINAKTGEMFPFVGSGSSSTVIITCQNPGEDWEIKLADGLYTLIRQNIIVSKSQCPSNPYIISFFSSGIGSKSTGIYLSFPTGSNIYRTS